MWLRLRDDCGASSWQRGGGGKVLSLSILVAHSRLTYLADGQTGKVNTLVAIIM
jgi:hypothetical protein